MSRVAVTMNKPENDRKTLMARGIVAMLLLSTLVQILSQTLIDNPDDINESMEPTEQSQSLYAQTYDVGNQTRGGYHLVSGDWWEPPRPIEVTTSDWDGDGTPNSLDDRPLDPSIPIGTISSCTRTIGNCTSNNQGFAARFDAATWESQESLNAQAVAVGDIDGDGDLDLAIGFKTAQDKVYLNEDGVLSSTPYWASPSTSTQDLAWGDIDGDGDVDLAVATKTYNYIYLNNGDNLSSTADWTSSDSKKSKAISLGDIDGDGDLDLVVGNGDSLSASTSWAVNQVFFNNAGTISTTAGWSSSDEKRTFDIELGDIDGDGTLDMVVANYNDNPQIFYNTGSGLSSTASSSWSPSETGHKAVALGDGDGDGRLDVALTKSSTSQIYYNSASGLSENVGWSSDSSTKPTSLAWGDVDADGDLDLIEGNGCCSMQEETSLYINRGGGLEETSSWTPDNDAVVNDIIWADFNGDGLLDLVRANDEEPVEVYMNRGSILETEPGWESSSATVYHTDWGDVDDDGDLDLAFGNTFYLQKDGVISSSADWTGSSGSGNDIEWVDVDDDGDLDLAMGRNGANLIYFNTGGNLSTTAGWTSSDSKNTVSIEFGDIDGDGDLDLAVGNYGDVNQVFFNSGSGLSTTAGWSSSDSQDTRDISLGDLNGDGDLDLVSGNYNQYTQAFYGSGTTLSTTASWSTTTTTNDNTATVHIADFNNDGDLDLFEGNWLGKDKIYLNSGNGLPTTSSLYVGTASDRTYGSGIGDVDSDGDIDISIAIDMNPDLLYINDGSGDFSLAWESGKTTDSEDHTFADVNGDSLLDLTIANKNDPVQIYYGTSDTDRDWYSDSNDDLDNDPTQYIDVDGDGHGDTSNGWSADDCTGYWGDSWRDRIGCPDEDGDGQSNLNDDFWRKDTQWVDTDGDGRGDNWGNSSWDAGRSGAWPGQYIANAYLQDPYPLDYDNDGFEESTLSGAVAPFDNCPFVYGLSTEDVNGCPDSDGDGYSDLSDSHSGDQTQWSDTDNDGYGDNWGDGAWNLSRAGGVGQWVQSASSPDNCPTIWGSSTMDYFGCTDNDGDGYSSLTDVDDSDGNDWNDADNDGFGDNADQCPFSWGNITLLSDKGCPDTDGDGRADRSDDLPNDATQWIDSDDDGYGDNIAGNTPDACKDDRGTSTRGVSAGANTTKYGCPDSDSDSYANTNDPCPFSYGNSWVDRFACPDSDQDGISDNVDPYPNNATSDIEDWDDDGFLDHSSGMNTDAFPADNTQNTDTDGDGFGDNAAGNSGDQFLNEDTQWQDFDGDGYGDNQAPGAFEPDKCPTTSGTSTIDRFGCTDTDGDGYSDSTPGYFAHPQGQADSHPNNVSQYRDKDGDGYGDNPSGVYPDSCDNNPGTSTRRVISSSGANETWYGCPDNDGDSYEDQSDPCKNQFGNSWVDRMGCPDSDQDGISDGNDPYPEDATSSIDDYDGDGVANSLDDFPADRTQSQDSDGDGYGDDPVGNSPDAFPNDDSQWQDFDNDGYGDNMDGVEPDECIYEAGNSTDPVFGCIDTDGDGAADDYDDFPRDPTQQLDSDGDGYGDDGDANLKDDCPYEMGDSTLGKIGCPDSDGDGWADDDDECPDQFGNSGEPFTGCLDRDGDNIADIVDIFPDDSNESTDSDGDGFGDNNDTCFSIVANATVDCVNDRDNDGFNDSSDVFPDDASEWSDQDGDGYGDNSDAWPGQSEIWSDGDGDGWADQYGHLLTDDCPSIPGRSSKFMMGCSDIDNDGMPDLLDPDIDGDGITNDNEMDASTDSMEYDPFDANSTPPDMDGDSIPDIMDKDTDGDGFPNDMEKERGSDHEDTNKTPFNIYGDQDTGLFYVPGEGFKSQYDPNGMEISVSVVLDMVTSEFLIPMLILPLTMFALLAKGRRYKKMKKRLEACKDADILLEFEKDIDTLIMKKKVKVEHGMLLRNLFERIRDKMNEGKDKPSIPQRSGDSGGPSQGRGRPTPAPKERSW